MYWTLNTETEFWMGWKGREEKEEYDKERQSVRTEKLERLCYVAGRETDGETEGDFIVKGRRKVIFMFQTNDVRAHVNKIQFLAFMTIPFASISMQVQASISMISEETNFGPKKAAFKIHVLIGTTDSTDARRYLIGPKHLPEELSFQLKWGSVYYWCPVMWKPGFKAVFCILLY